MKLRDKEEKQRQRDREKEEKEKLKEKEKDERNKREEKNKREREEKERQKQIEKMEKFKLKEEREKQKQKEREEREKEKKLEKEEREKEKQRLREERKRYNETFQNSSIKLRRNIIKINAKANTHNIFKISENSRPTGGNYYQRNAYNSSRLYQRKRRHSHKRIQPKNHIPRLEAKKNLGKTTLKIMKPKRYEEDETDTEPADLDDKLMKFPKFRAKYGKNYFKNKNKFGNNKPREMEIKIGDNTKTNLTISEVDEEDEKNNKLRNNRKGRKLSHIKPKGKYNMDKKMKDILGKQYILFVDDPNNPYGTAWASNFLKCGYDAGFEYENFQSGVPVLKLKNLGKKQLPPIKKKGINKNEQTIYSPNRNTGGQYPGTSAKKNIHEENVWDNKTNKTETLKNFNAKLNSKESENKLQINGLTENDENKN